MTEYEYLDLIVTSRDSVGYHAMNYIGVMFAYVVAAYLVGVNFHGSKRSRSQFYTRFSRHIRAFLRTNR